MTKSDNMINYFHCPGCGKTTKHLKVSWREFLAAKQLHGSAKGPSWFFQGLGVVWDVSFVPIIFGRTPYKCTECGSLASRTSAGEIDDVP